MKLKFNKLLVASVVFTILSFGLLLASLFTNDTYSSSSFFPEYRFPDSNRRPTDEILIEKIVHTQEDGKDLRSPVYLTHHGYFLSNIANIKVDYRHRTYTINDICYKPHFAIFEDLLAPGNVEKLPDYLQRLLLEVQRLSPCLIVTPLNCYNDSYRIHSEITKWNVETDYLNRKLRNSYIDAVGENYARPYVKSSYGPDLIKGWAHHMLKLPSMPLSNFSKSDVSRRIELWLSSIEPKGKVCADPTRPCFQSPDNYYNICMKIQQVRDFDERRKQFQLEDGDEEFTTQLDCVEDREKFIEWMQKRELREMIKNVSYHVEIPNHMDITKQSCDGIYHDSKSSGLEFFHGSRSFGNSTGSFDSMNTEIGLMTPDNILANMKRSDYVNGFESVWTFERAQELLEEFQVALQEEVKKFNENLPSRSVRVTTEIAKVEVKKVNQEEVAHSTITFLLGATILVFTLFSIFVFAESVLFSLTMFLIRSAITGVFFSILCKSEGIILLDYNFLGYVVLHVIINLFLTTRVALLAERIRGCIQSRNGYTKSNFSSLGSVPVDSIKEGSDARQVRYVLAQYTDYQVAVDAYSSEPFEKLSKYWIITSLLLVPIVGFYWFFVDSDVQKICIILLPSFVVAAYEELRIKNDICRDRKAKKEVQKALEVQTERLYSERSYVNIFSGNTATTGEKSHHKSNEANIQKETKLYELPRSSYDASQIMAYPNAFCRYFRFKAFGICFKLRNARAVGLLIIAIFALFILLSVSLLFIPVQRSTFHEDSADFRMNENDLFIDFSIKNVSSSWETINRNLELFNSEIDFIGSLRTISNWKKSFDRFEGRINQNGSHYSGIDRFTEWIDKEPISWSLTAPLTRPSRKARFSNSFQFRFRYEFDANQQSAVLETVQKIDALLSKYSQTLSFPNAAGVLYEHYHRNAVVWNSFAYHELLAAPVLVTFFALIVVIFAVKPTIFSSLIFAFFVVGTRLEIAAIATIFSLEYHQVYINFAVLIGFLAAWTPYCDLARFRARCLYKDQTRTAPELAPNRRIRYPFIAAVDTIQVFAILFAASSILAIITAFVPRFNFFLLPTIIFIATQLIALANSIAIIITTNRMFEHEVRLHYHDQTRGLSATAQVRDLSRKLLHSRPEDMDIPLTDFSIQPAEDSPKFYGPPPPKLRKSEDKEKVDIEAGEGTSSGISTVDDVPRQFSEHTQRVATMSHPVVQPLINPESSSTSYPGYMPNLFILGGAPMDANHGVFPHKPDQLPANLVPKKEEGDTFGLGGNNEDEDSYPSSGDDSGDSDKEREEVANEFASRTAEKKVKEELEVVDPKIPGPSDRQEPLGESPSSAIASDLAAPRTRYVLYHRQPRLYEIPDIIERPNGRNVYSDPPNLVEYIQLCSNPNHPVHPRTNQYPPEFDQAMIHYCDDRYWLHNQERLPDGLRMPPRPFDWEQIRHIQRAPAMEMNYVAPPGRPCIPIPPEAVELYIQMCREQDNQNRNPPDDPPGL